MLYQDTGYILDDAISDYRIVIGNLPVLICYAIFCFSEQDSPVCKSNSRKFM